MRQAVILAGGRGTRLAERLNGRPKPLIDVNGLPLLERQLSALSAHGVEEVLVLVNHAAEQIERFVADRDFGCRVRLIDDGEPRGTAGAVLACMDALAESFFVIYGDTLFDVDLAHLYSAHKASGAQATLFVHPNDHPDDSDLVEIDEACAVVAFHAYPHPPGAELRNLVNAAMYVVERRALQPWRSWSPPLDFARDLFPAMLASGAHLHGYVSFEYIKDLGTPRRLDKVESAMRAGAVARASRSAPQKAVFLDRDGTLNVLRDYVRSAQELEMIPAAGAAVRRFNDAELRTVLITNQPVLARGECTESELNRIHARLSSRLGDAGAFLDAVYYCPHHPDGGFPGEVAALKVSCECRKPDPGLFRRAAADMNIDLAQSWMVGDSTADMAAAATLGLTSVLVRTGEGGRDGKHACDPDFTEDDVGAAAELIARVYPELVSRVRPTLKGLMPGSLVFVGGPARSGKTTLAGVIRRELRRQGRACAIVGLDSWIRPTGARGPGVLGRFDLGEAAAALGPWLAGGRAAFRAPGYNRLTRTRTAGGWRTAPADAVLVVEGVPALLAEWPTTRPVVRIHIEADAAVRSSRVVADLVGRGLASPEEGERVYAQREIDETAPVSAAASRADIRISTAFAGCG